MGQPFHSSFSVDTGAGSLHVAVAGPPPGTPGVPVVAAVHGITASHRSWVSVARHLGDAVTVLAPDLRGRGLSAAVGGPFGMAVHAADVVTVLDHVGCPRAVLAGHSMGAYVVVRFAAEAPERLAGAVLVDGGVPLPRPPDVDPDVLLAAVLGPSLARLDMTFPSVEAYRDFWRGHPALASQPLTGDAAEFIDYDLGPPETGADGQVVYRSRVSKEAVRGDGRDLLDSDSVAKALASLSDPCLLLWAPRGLMNEERPLLPPEAIADARAVVPHLEVVEVPDTNHYLLLLGDREPEVVAEAIRRVALPGSS